MKRIFAGVLCAFLVLSSLMGCGAPRQAEIAPKLKIVTTIFPQYDFARQIAGGNADLTMLLKPGAESHSYEPSPQDIKTIQHSDIFIYTGGENDVWIEDLLSSLDQPQPTILRLMDYVDVVPDKLVEGMEHGHYDHKDKSDEHDKHGDHEDEEEGHESHGNDDHHEDEHHEDEHHEDEHHEDDHHKDDHHEDDHHETEMDEHVWTSPKNAIKIVKAISDLMEMKDPEHAAIYSKNSNEYIQKLTTLDIALKQISAEANRKTILFGDRFPFRYLADAYGLNYYAAFSGCSTETEASAATVAFLIDKVEEEKLPVIFTIELSNGKIADTISDGTGAKVVTLHSCHNITKEEFEQGATYLSLMEMNIEKLKEALN